MKSMSRKCFKVAEIDGFLRDQLQVHQGKKLAQNPAAF